MTYSITYGDSEGSATIEVDEAKFTREMAKEHLDFFSWHEWNPSEYAPVKAAAITHGLQAIITGTCEYLSLTGVINRFAEKEGYYSLDGTYGLKLTHLDIVDFDFDLVTVKVTSN